MSPRVRIIFVSTVMVAAAVVALVWFRSDPGSDTIVLRPNDAQLVAMGGAVYKTHCAVCHGAKLEGQPDWRSRGADGMLPAPPHDASGHTWHHPDATLFRITKKGVAAVAGDANYKTTMQAYEGILTDEEIVAVLSWIKAQWPASVRAKHDQINAAKARSP